jgi:putative membrane protein
VQTAQWPGGAAAHAGCRIGTSPLSETLMPTSRFTPLARPSALAAAAFAAALALGSAAQAQTPTQTPTQRSTASNQTAASVPAMAVAREDRQFVEKAADGGKAEVMLGELAQKQASDEQVKQFGNRMVKDHGKANDELARLASAKGISLPTTVGREHRAHADKLAKLSGAAFDRAYMKHMVDDHKKDISEFEKQAKSGKDAELKAFAERTLPTLREHLKLAQATHDAVSKVKS